VSKEVVEMEYTKEYEFPHCKKGCSGCNSLEKAVKEAVGKKGNEGLVQGQRNAYQEAIIREREQMARNDPQNAVNTMRQSQYINQCKVELMQAVEFERQSQYSDGFLNAHSNVLKARAKLDEALNGGL